MGTLAVSALRAGRNGQSITRLTLRAAGCLAAALHADGAALAQAGGNSTPMRTTAWFKSDMTAFDIWDKRNEGAPPGDAPGNDAPGFAMPASMRTALSHMTRDLSGAFGAVSRGSAGADGAIATFDTGFESLAPLPAELVNQNDTVTWGGAAATVTGRPRFVAATPPLVVPQYGVATEAVAGNATKKLRGFVAPPAMGPNTFFGRWARYELVKVNTATGAVQSRFTFRPDIGQNVRIVHDTFVNSIDSLWTSEPTYVSSGIIIARLLWGGQNATTGIGLPVGPIPDFYTLAPCGADWFCGLFSPCTTPATYVSGAPYPGGAGFFVPVPVGSWFKIITETTVDGRLIHKLDRNDGHGELVIWNEPNSVGPVGRVDRMAFAGGYEADNNTCYIDNLHIDGVEFTLPVAPPLKCDGGDFVDDFEWLHTGNLSGQSSQVFNATSAQAIVVDLGPPQGKVVRRANSFSDDHYRRENGRTLPLTFATGVGPFRLCVEVSIPSSAQTPNATVHGIAPVSLTDNEYVSRLFIGRFDPFNPPAVYNSRLYAQINPAYNPIDDESWPDPYSAGPNGNGGVPVIGVDVADTGVNWAYNAFRNVCFDVDKGRNMTVSVGGSTVFTGSSFVNSIDRLDLECENNWPGAGDSIDYDNIVLTCAVLPSVTLPPLTLVYHDDLEWGIEGVTIGVHDDDGNSATPFRWASAPNMPIVTPSVDGSMKALQMENLFRDTPAGAPNTPEFISFTQASTGLPHVTGSTSRGWTVRADMRLTDGATSRTWAAAQATIAATQFARIAGLTFSSVTGTFWAQVPAPTMAEPFATSWIDSGAGLSVFGSGFNQTFTVAISRSTGAKHTFRINGRLLRFVGGPSNGSAVVVDPLASLANGTHKDLDRFFYLGSDESAAPPGSILYTDNIRAWSLPCLGDTNNDGVVNFADLNNVLGFFGQSAAPGSDITGNVAPDANRDGVPDDDTVSFIDLNAVLSGFGTPCTATN